MRERSHDVMVTIMMTSKAIVPRPIGRKYGSYVVTNGTTTLIGWSAAVLSSSSAMRRGVGAGDAVAARATVPGAVAVGRAVVGTGVGVGGTVGASVRNGDVGEGVGSGSGSVAGFSATGGCSGAFGFFGCASA